MPDSSYIEVAVNLPIDQTFTYKISKQLKVKCQIGMRVLVFFRRKRVTGYVLKKYSVAPDFRTKEILEIMDDYPMFPKSDINFFRWISKYYIHPIGEVIKSALPAGLDQQDIFMVSVTENGRIQKAENNLSSIEIKIINQIEQKKQVSLKTLLNSNTTYSSTKKIIHQMETRKLIQISSVLKKEGVRPKMEKFLLLHEPLPKHTSGMSKKRISILNILQKTEGMFLSSLKLQIPTAQRLIKPMIEEGWIDIEWRRILRDPLGEPVEPDIAPELTTEQNIAVSRVLDNKDKGFTAYLLYGVTGSGKTEVYMRLVADAIAKGKTAIVLVPEIALISQTEHRFRARFGEKIAVIHSMLSKGERLDQWRQIAMGHLRIVIGARSAVFAPLINIGIIIVDEEHDTSYKQETGLKYNARDLCVVRAKMHRCPVILGSATPSVQSFHNVKEGRFQLLTLENRVNEHPMPNICLVDLKKYKDGNRKNRIITYELAREIRKCLESGNQALIFLNRRGFASFPACRECGKSLFCKYCDVTMTFHRKENKYKCHLCGFILSSEVSCPECGKKKIQNFGFGTEQIEDMLKVMFPDARLARMDQDSMAKKGNTLQLLKSIRNRTVDIIVGTQMIAKGHDFPYITLVGIICADISLNLPDFRAGEKTFQLLAQVAGRAGRGTQPGRVVMQTYNPEHFTIEAAKNQNFLQFFNHEIPYRKALKYPPFTRMIQLKISGKEADKVEKQAKIVASIIYGLLKERRETEHVSLMGPIESAIPKIAARFRWHLLLKSQSANLLNYIVHTMIRNLKVMKNVTIGIDVDPYFLM